MLSYPVDFAWAKIAQNLTVESKMFLSRSFDTKSSRQVVYIKRIAALYLQGKQQQVKFKTCRSRHQVHFVSK